MREVYLLSICSPGGILNHLFLQRIPCTVQEMGYLLLKRYLIAKKAFVTARAMVKDGIKLSQG